MASGDSNSGFRQIILQAVVGVAASLPVGIWLYFAIILLWAMAINVFAIPMLLVPKVGSAIMTWANFSRGMVPILVIGAGAMEVWACRVLIRRHFPVFAYTQAILGLGISLPFFYWSFVHQKPLLPFWGQ
jgi:hypothetical protein